MCEQRDDLSAAGLAAVIERARYPWRCVERCARSDSPEQLTRYPALLDQQLLADSRLSEKVDRLGQERRLLDGVDQPWLVAAPTSGGDGSHRVAIGDIAEPPQPARAVQQRLHADSPLLLEPGQADPRPAIHCRRE